MTSFSAEHGLSAIELAQCSFFPRIDIGARSVRAYVDAMGEIVNLRRAKKAKARTAADIEAAQNRAKFGQSKSAKALRKAEREAESRKLDGHKRDGKSDES